MRDTAILIFEIKNWLKSPLFYILVTTFFLFSLMTMLGTGGYFDGPVQRSENTQLLNSPYSLTFICFLLAKLLLFVVAIIAGFSLYRDYKNDTHAILYSFPISKWYYLNSKISSVILMLILVCFLAFVGIFTGEMLLGIDNPKIATTNLLAYLVSFGLYMLPTLITIGVFVFVVVGISRNIYAGFVVVIGFVLFQFFLANVILDNKNLLAMLDPFGQYAFQGLTSDWGIVKQNSGLLPVNRIIIFNRILWALFATLFYLGFANKFDFQFNSMIQVKKLGSRKRASVETVKTSKVLSAPIKFSFSGKARIKAFLYLMWYDFKSILTSWLFLVLTFLSVLTVFFIQIKVSNTGEFNLMPFTRIFISSPLLFYTLVVILSTFLFSGFLVNKAKQNKMNLMLDVTPVKNWQLVTSKVGAISLIHIVQLLFFLVVSIGIQTYNGFYNFELELYCFHLFILVFPVLFVWNLTSHFIHTLIPNLFLGLFILGCIWMGGQSLDQIGIHTNLLKYNTLPILEYTDLNGYGTQLKGYFLLLSYWLILGFLLLIITVVIWNRGSLNSFKERLLSAKTGLNKIVSFSIIILCFNFFWLGSMIYNAELIEKNTFYSGSNRNEIFSEYKKDWESYGNIIQPKITDVDLDIDLYPSMASFFASGSYILVNKSNTPIDTLFVRTGFDENTKLDLEARLLKSDNNLKSYLYKLNTQLQPGDSLQFTFTVENTPNTIFSRNSNVLSNGTYLKHDILPRMGYQFLEKELNLGEQGVNQFNYYYRDGDYVNLTTRVSTDINQTAIAPGELISESVKGDRKQYKYATKDPVKINFSIHSSNYELIEESYGENTIQVYYKKGHQQNINFMIEGLKASIDFNTKLFGAYPYEQIRIIEFPHTEESYAATLITNNIPTSELLFNVNCKVMEDKANFPFYVMIHELTHEWFGNQVMPAGAEGAKMLTESITEYITLCVYRKHLGEDMANEFLETQRKRYTKGKKIEKGEEKALYKVSSHQDYIAYGKGAIVFNEIANTIGEEKLHDVLNQYLVKYRSVEYYYPTTLDFLLLLEANVNREEYKTIEYLLTDMSVIK